MLHILPAKAKQENAEISGKYFFKDFGDLQPLAEQFMRYA
jgi:hypothetical protein